MDSLEKKLKPFEKRVRGMRAWHGAGFGLLVAAALCGAWLVLDLMNIWYASWQSFAFLGAAGAVCGAVIGFFKPVRTGELAASVDRRAGLKDRVGTALDARRQKSELDAAQREDAEEWVDRSSPKALFPFRVARQHYFALAAGILVCGVFLVGTTDLMASDGAKKAKKEAEVVAKRLEQTAKPIEKRAERLKPELRADQRKLAFEMRKAAEKLKRGRMNKEQAMQKANDLAEQAKKLAAEQSKQVRSDFKDMKERLAQELMKDSQLDKQAMAQMAMSEQEKSAMEQTMAKAGMDSKALASRNITQEMLDSMGLQNLDSRMMNMSDEEASKYEEALKKEIEELEKLEKSGQKLTKEQQEQLDMLRKAMEKFKLSEQARKAMQELAESKEFQELQKAMQEMAEKMQKIQQQMEEGQTPDSMTMEEMEEAVEKAMKAMEDFAEEWSQPEFQEQMKDQMRQMLEDLKNGKLTIGQCMSCLGMMPGLMPGLSPGVMPGGPPIGAAMPGGAFSNTEQINKLDKPEAGKGKTQQTGVRGQRDAKRGTEAFVEIKAPTTLGGRSSVPYSQVLPKYKKDAEKAIERSRIPKEHQDRVKKYFDSLSGGVR